MLPFRYPSGFSVILSAEACLVEPRLLSRLALFAAQSGTLVVERVVGAMSYEK